ncbi:uncharacterized protein LOC116847201, partial [Odontomachus brunneus]|uniref:uncharacterized protein LOC116847201 n=1 Tax=Odontomachus brunneus TaxID=486640 RepID=UPI0013F1A194
TENELSECQYVFVGITETQQTDRPWAFLHSLYPTQVEGTPTSIVSGRASKIPPIYKRPTTSNISVEEGGVLNVSKSCNRQPLPLSVSRGVRSRPLGEGIASSTKVDTIPLLSPTMESELLKEPWTSPHKKPASPTKEEDTAAFPAWEEDFQDLSSWCMDTFQAQCDFHIGESTTFKLSGTKYEGNGVSTVEEDGLLKGLRSKVDDEKLNLKMDTVKTMTGESSDNHLLLSPTELVNKYEKGYGNEENCMSSSWLMSPESTASTSTSSSKQYNTTDVSAPFQHEYRVSNDYACPTSFDSTASQHETWDELPTIETIGSDTFDLLSYLCDDEMRSPEGSVSTDSTAMLKHRPLTMSSPILTPTSTKVKTEETNASPKPRRMETRATSTVTSSSVETPTTSSRRSERKLLVNNKEKEKTTVKAKKEKNAKKRYYESESDEDIALIQYRESREKNNEASRKSRMNKKVKESEMSVRAIQLEKDNKILKMKVEELEKLVTSMRNALLQSALKKEF